MLPGDERDAASTLDAHVLTGHEGEEAPRHHRVIRPIG